jgi:EpsI family protein
MRIMPLPLTRVAMVAAVLAATLLVSRSASPSAPERMPALASLPFEMGEWTGVTAPPLDPEVEASLAADQYLRRYYRGDRGHSSGAIEMDIAYYGQPRVGASMHSPLNCLPGNGWEIAGIGERSIATAIGPVDIRELTVVREGARYALTYWFQSRHRIVADELSARLHLLGDALRRRPADAGLARLIMPLGRDSAGDGRPQREQMAAFAARLIPEIDVRLR